MICEHLTSFISEDATEESPRRHRIAMSSANDIKEVHA